MKQILIPTDFSENAWNAIQYGLELMKDQKCTFHLIHVNPMTVYSGAESSVLMSGSEISGRMVQETLVNLKKRIEKIESDMPNPNHYFVPVSLYDFFAESIKREVDHRKIDLIIMGTKGAGGLKKATIGSNTGDIITRVKCPLIAVPEKSSYSGIREIAFPTDYQIGYDMKVLDDLLEIAKINKASIRIVHISKKGEVLSSEQEQNKEFLKDYLLDIPHTFHCLPGTRLDTVIQQFCESHQIGMIAMVAKNLNFFQQILFRPRVEEISYHTKIPFLVLHE